MGNSLIAMQSKDKQTYYCASHLCDGSKVNCYYFTLLRRNVGILKNVLKNTRLRDFVCVGILIFCVGILKIVVGISIVFLFLGVKCGRLFKY